MKEYVVPILEEELYLTKSLGKDIFGRASKFIIHNGKLCRRGCHMPLCRCLSPEEANYVLKEVYGRVCGTHINGRALSNKIIRHGYFWPTIAKDALDSILRCDVC